MERFEDRRRQTIPLTEGRNGNQFEIVPAVRQGLRMQNIESGRSMSDIFFEALANRTRIAKAWAALRKTA